jgi:large subunit ribosomal protein L3
MKKRNPRHGSMQFWPRVKSKRAHARVRTWNNLGKGALGFAGYKVGMTHVMVTDNKATSKTKGETISWPVTILECPPLKVASIRFYKNSPYGSKAVSQILAQNLDKTLSKIISMPKKEGKKIDDIKGFDDISLVVYTQPGLTGIGKKKPEMFEIGVGGNNEEKLAYAKEKLGQEIKIEDVFKPGEQIDIHSVTKGKGFQGPMKRFGISRTSHRSEKSVRNPGSLGGWKAQGHVMYRVAHAGQTGYHQRTEYNKYLLKIGDKPEEVQQKGGFVSYGAIKNHYIVLKGSIGGARKRLIKMSHAIRPLGTMPKEAPAITSISTASKQ